MNLNEEDQHDFSDLALHTGSVLSPFEHKSSLKKLESQVKESKVDLKAMEEELR